MMPIEEMTHDLTENVNSNLELCRYCILCKDLHLVDIEAGKVVESMIVDPRSEELDCDSRYWVPIECSYSTVAIHFTRTHMNE